MNLSETIVDYFRETKNIYINIALVLGLIIVFIIFPLPIPSSFLFFIKIIIVLSLTYLIIKNFQHTVKMMNDAKNNSNKDILEKTVILSNIVNLGLLILSLYIWYIIFF
jgi:hypothetical protein